MNSKFRRTPTSTSRIINAGLIRLGSRRGKLFVLAALATVALIAVCTTLASRPETQPLNSAPSANVVARVTVSAAGRGKPFFNFADGRQMPLKFRAQNEATQALQSGQAAPRALASADLDGNGAPDLVTGHAYGGTGIVTIQRGNPDAYAPQDQSVYERMQSGYNPEALLPTVETFEVPEPADFVQIGDFTGDGRKDILAGARHGVLMLLKADESSGFLAAEEVQLPGQLTSLTAGEFRAPDGKEDVAVGVSGPGGSKLLIYDGATGGLTGTPMEFLLPSEASVIRFDTMDADSFVDAVVAAGSEIRIVHGWGRKQSPALESRLERVSAGSEVRGLSIGHFIWDREGRREIAVLTEDGNLQLIQAKGLNTTKFTDAELVTRNRERFRPQIMQQAREQDLEAAPSWNSRGKSGWATARTVATNAVATGVSSLTTTNMNSSETDEVVITASKSELKIVRQTNGNKVSESTAPALTGDMAQLSLTSAAPPVAALQLSAKLNGERNMLVLQEGATALAVVPLAPATITVDRFDDPDAGAPLQAADNCTAALNDCSLRGAIEFANLAVAADQPTTINLPAGTYTLDNNGTAVAGCDNNPVGDLTINGSVAMVGLGGGAIIQQLATGVSNDGDRAMCLNLAFAINKTYSFSNLTIVGGRDGSSPASANVLGGGGIIGGELDNLVTLTNVTLANNQVIGAAMGTNNNLGGGGIQITGGDLTITNCTIGGANAPGTYADRSNITTGNSQNGSGGGVTFTPSSPMHMGGTGDLIVTGTTFNRNAGTGIGGGGADLLIFAFAGPGGIGSGSASIGTSTFSNNTASNGGGIIVESLPTTINSSTNFNTNSASNRGGGIYVGGGSLLLNGAALPAITFSGNTATSGGSSISTTGPVSVDGTNTTIGGDIEINTGGTWTNNAGSVLSPTNVVVNGGTFTMNNSTMNVSGNLSIASAPLFVGTFNGGTGTVNIQGNFSFTAGGPAPGTTLNAGTGTFNFNGTGSQSISNTASITFFNLTDSNINNPLTLNNSLAVNGTLNVNGANAILSPVAAAVISGAGTLTGTGTSRASRIGANPDFLSQYTITNKTLTNLTIDYNGAGNQTVNNTPAYSQLRISGSGIKTLQGNTAITSNLNIIAGATFAGSTFNFGLGGNWTNAATFTAGTGTVTFAGTTGIQTLTGNTAFFSLTLNNAGATTNFSNTTTTVGNDLVASAGTMDGGASTIIFTGVTDNLGSISGVAAKNFHNLQVNSPATISNTAGANITIEGNYTNAGTFTQAAGLTTIFGVDNAADGAHTLAGAGTTTFGNFTINASNTVDAGSHNFNLVGAAFTSTGAFTGNTGTVTFNGGVAQAISGDGVKNFGGLLINNVNGVSVLNGAQPVDASVLGILTLNTDLTVASGAILQQSGTSAGAADVLGTVRRTDLGGVARSFGNVNNTIQINSGTPPTQMDFNLVKATPTGFPSAVKVVPRTYALTPTGGAGLSATLRLRYIDPAELAGPGITESRLVLWKDTTGSDNWVAQGGTVDTAGNHVTHTGISSFSEWAIAEAADLTLSKANNVSGSAVVGQPWNWTLTASNTGSPATFTAGQTIISDNLPNSNITYGTPTVQNASNITGSANISCAIVSNDLTCVASGGSVTFNSNIGASSFEVVFSATPQAIGSFQNPRTGGGIAQIDPNNVIAESSEINNSPAANTVTVGKANTTTTINSDNPDPSVVGQAVTVTWSVTVNGPGAVGAPLTGNVTVSDGTNQCVAAVSAGQCDVTFTSAGAKGLTATYAGDTNYNGSASTPATPHTVNAANTTTTITEDNPDPSTPGASVTVKWTVTVDSPGAGTPTGNVNVTVSGGAENCNAPVATGQCSLALTGTGNRTITATYVGNSNFNTSFDTKSHSVCSATIVTSALDDGSTGTLRKVITDACEGDTVTFDISGSGPHTITLTTGELVLNKNLTIKNMSGERITVSGNVAGRVFNINAGKTAAIIGLTITGGNSAQNGGGILNEGTLTVVNSTLTGNLTAIDGGAISNSATATSLTLINTTVSGNDANGFGGGVDVLGGTVTIINSTITGNRGDFDDNAAGGAGGVRRQGGTVTLHNTIVAGNFKGAVTPVANDIEGTVEAASSNNLVGDAATSGGLSHGTNNNIVGNAGSGTIVLSTVIGALANNGGLTNTHALVASGVAVEAGSNANLPADTFDVDGDANTAETLPVDQRGLGYPRISDSADVNTTQTVDIGAFELHPSVEDITDKTTPEDTSTNFNFNIGDDNVGLITSVVATSSNTTLVPDANLVETDGTANDGVWNLSITPAANQSGITTITVTVTATNGRTAQDTFDLTVTAVSDPPTANSITPAAFDEDMQSVITLSYTDPESDLATACTISSPTNVTVTQPCACDGGGVCTVGVTGTANYNGAASFTYTVTAGLQDSNSATASLTINPVNDPPSFTIAGNPPAVSQDAGGQTVLSFATSISQGPNETGQTLTFNITPTGSTGTLTFSSAPAIDATTGTLTYTATNGTSGTATFSVTLSDTGSNTPPNSNTSGAQSFTITVNAPNASPVVTTTSGNLAYTENAGAVAIDDGLTVTDSDNTDLTGATVAITSGFVSAQDTLAFTNQLGITGNYDSGTGILTLTGATTVANYQTALRTVTYANSSENPTAARTITFTATDGISTHGSATRGIAITAVNDGPVNTVPGAQSTNEDTAKVFSSGNGNQISVADVDAGSADLRITLTAANGTLTLASTAGLNFACGGCVGDGAEDGSMIFEGTLTEVNTALNGMSFNPTPDFNGAASVSITSNDLGNSGSGGALSDGPDTVNIPVDAANDSPVVTTTAGNLSYIENDPATAIDPGLTVTDVDDTNLEGATVAITSGFDSAQDTLAFTNQLGITGNYNSGAGVLTLTGTASVANYQTALRSVTYQNSSDEPTASRTVTFTADDGTSTGSSTRGITVNALNDPPVNTVPGAQGTNQNTPLTFTGGNQISVADEDAGSNTIQVTLTASNGTLTLSGVSGLTFSFTDANGTGAGDGTADGTMTFRGTLTNINNALNGMTYTPTLGFSGAATLTVTSNDLGNTGSGGPLSDTDVVNIQVATNMSVQNAQLPEPPSGTANMLFTVTLSAPALAGGSSVNYTTADQAPALNHAVGGGACGGPVDYITTAGTLTFSAGEQFKTIAVPICADTNAAESNETFELNLSGATNATLVTPQGIGTITTTNQPGTLLISELRTSGPGGAGDDFVEVYNNSNSPLTVAASDASAGYGLYKMGADCNAAPVLIGVIPNGTVIPARGHFLFVGSAYSLGNYGGSGAAAGNLTLSADIESDANVGLFSTSDVTGMSSANRLDAVGFGNNTGGNCDLLREGTNQLAVNGSVAEYSYFRKQCEWIQNQGCTVPGIPKDTNDNSADFWLADTAATAFPSGIIGVPPSQRLGAPGPENLASPIRRDNANNPDSGGINVFLLDSGVGTATYPNRSRDTTSGSTPVTFGTMTLRYRVTNNTGASVTRLRYRVVDISTAIPPAGLTADLRALSSILESVGPVNDAATCTAGGAGAPPCTVTVQATTLEQPPTQAIGGGYNSTLSSGTITTGTPLGNGQSILINFKLGVEKTGTFRFYIIVEALP